MIAQLGPECDTCFACGITALYTQLTQVGLLLFLMGALHYCANTMHLCDTIIASAVNAYSTMQAGNHP